MTMFILYSKNIVYADLVVCAVCNIRCHASGDRCQVSGVTFFSVLSFFYKVVGLVGGGLL